MTEEPAPEIEEGVEILSFLEIKEIKVETGTTLEEVMKKLPTTVVAVLSNEKEIKIPVDWRCEGKFHGDEEGEYTFDARVKKNEDGTPYEIGYPLTKDLTFPHVIVSVETAPAVAEGAPEAAAGEEKPAEEEKVVPIVMDDVTGANIGPIEGEKEVFEFLVKKLKLNYAAACGVLANIVYESNFNPHAIGDGGTSYGLCQWHLGRYTALVKFCKEHDLSYGSVEGQMRYLEYELEHGYSHVLDYLRSVPNTAEGAFRAGYYWCFHYERPAYVYQQSNLRGNAAKNSYWPRFRNYRIKSWIRIRRYLNRQFQMES